MKNNNVLKGVSHVCSMSTNQKVYQGVLQEIRRLIKNNALKPGDKLPSERQLSDKLQAGRSSVREALRAMELLGLIETKHGEGTFLSTYRPFQTIELLSSFILQESNTKKDLLLAKKILEKEAVKLAFIHMNMDDIKELGTIVQNTEMKPHEKHKMFFNFLFDKVDNLLLARVWQLMEDFSHTINKYYYDEAFYKELVLAYSEKNYKAIEVLCTELAHSYIME
ncbi:FadR/GntR family transcriptional regulator [Virgibacillus ainsalahensis]